MKPHNVVKDIKSLIFRFQDDDVLAMSSQLAYSMLLAFFPFLMFLLTVVGFSPIKSEDVLAGLKGILPKEAYSLIRKTVVEVVDTKNGHLLSLSLVFTVWSASSGLTAVIKGLNKAYDEEEKRSFIKVQIVAILNTIALVFMILAAFIFLVFGNVLGKFIASHLAQLNGFWKMWDALRYFGVILNMILIFTVIYHFIPSRRLHWKEVLPGAIFTTIGWIVVSIGFAFYIDNFGNYSLIYGSLGAVFTLMTWLFISSIIILLGGELNATLAFDREGKEKPKGKNY